jgi:hypothetical protein
MLSLRRGPTFSYDPTSRRDGRREHWIPTGPGEGDLRGRAYPVVQMTTPPEETVRHEVDELAS